MSEGEGVSRREARRAAQRTHRVRRRRRTIVAIVLGIALVGAGIAVAWPIVAGLFASEPPPEDFAGPGSGEIVIPPAEVVCVDMQGGRSYQISGQEETRPLGEPGIPAERGFPEEDVDLVMSQTGCDRDAAIAALKASDGQPAEAIISVISG